MRLVPNETVLRVALLIFNIIFGNLSISLIVLGVVYADELWWPKHYIGLDFVELPTLLIILGSLSLAMSLAGCLCAKTDNRKFLLTFALVLVVILALELAVAVIAFINFDSYDGPNTPTHKIMARQLQENAGRKHFHSLESHMKCCGITGKEGHCTNSGGGLMAYNRQPRKGCADIVNDKIQTTALEIGSLASVLLLLQIIQGATVYGISEFTRASIA